MMPIEHIPALSQWLAATDIGLLELRGPQGSLRLRQDGGRIEVERDSVPAPASITVAAPVVGIFLHRHPLHDAPLVRPGERVRSGQPLGLLQIGALLVAVPAPQDGVMAELAAADGTAVGYGTALVILHPLPR